MPCASTAGGQLWHSAVSLAAWRAAFLARWGLLISLPIPPARVFCMAGLDSASASVDLCANMVWPGSPRRRTRHLAPCVDAWCAWPVVAAQLGPAAAGGVRAPRSRPPAARGHQSHLPSCRPPLVQTAHRRDARDQPGPAQRRDDGARARAREPERTRCAARRTAPGGRAPCPGARAHFTPRLAALALGARAARRGARQAASRGRRRGLVAAAAGIECCSRWACMRG